MAHQVIVSKKNVDEMCVTIYLRTLLSYSTGSIFIEKHTTVVMNAVIVCNKKIGEICVSVYLLTVLPNNIGFTYMEKTNYSRQKYSQQCNRQDDTLDSRRRLQNSALLNWIESHELMNNRYSNVSWRKGKDPSSSYRCVEKNMDSFFIVERR